MKKSLLAIGALLFSGVAIYAGVSNPGTTAPIATDSNNTTAGSSPVTPLPIAPIAGNVSQVTPQPPPTPATTATPTPTPKPPKDKNPPKTLFPTRAIPKKQSNVKTMLKNL